MAEIQCPNCREPAEKSGNTIICPACDATYKITKTGAANVVQLGRVEKLENRIGALEALLNPEPNPEQEDLHAEEIAEDETDDDDILPP